MVFPQNKATPWSNLQVRTCKIQAKLDSKLDPSVAIEEIIPFPVFKTSFGVVVKTLKHFVKEVFYWKSENRKNNSISCLNNSISCFQNQFWTYLKKLETFCKSNFLIRGREIGEIVPFPVWIIPFPVFQASFGLIGKS